MRKTFAGVGAAAVMATVVIGSGGSAQAAPSNEKFSQEWVCEGEDVVIISPGSSRVGVLDGVLYLAVEVTFEGTFTPTGGEPQDASFSKTWANGHGLDDPDAITCTQHVEETGPEGTFVADGTVVAVPVH